jgi:hypothetical protein
MTDESRTEGRVENVRANTSAAAARALAEAEARRKAGGGAGEDTPAPPEFDGRGGAEPVRYGDWEKDGRAVDF